MPLRVLLADDHPVVRRGCRILLEEEGLEIVGEAGDGHEALLLTLLHNPDVVVLDVSMPLMNGLDAAREILQVSPPPKIILLTMHDEDYQMVAALRVGIHGYVLKSEAAEELVQAIREAAGGGFYVSPRVRQLADASPGGGEVAPDPLTPRERELLQMIAEGRRTKEIASLLGLSVQTTEARRARLKEKLGVHDTAGLVRHALRQGLIEAVFAWCVIALR